jgi:hypothetical protein
MQANIWNRSYDQINANLKGEANKILSQGNKLNVIDLILSITLIHEENIMQ